VEFIFKKSEYNNDTTCETDKYSLYFIQKINHRKINNAKKRKMQRITTEQAKEYSNIFGYTSGYLYLTDSANPYYEHSYITPDSPYYYDIKKGLIVEVEKEEIDEKINIKKKKDENI
jgi:hypothetical protein